LKALLKLNQIPKFLIVGAIAITIVVAGGLIGWLKLENGQPAPVPARVSAEPWEATSTRQSVNPEEPVEIRDLPVIPQDDGWEISPLPDAEKPQFQPLPAVERDLQFQQLPPMESGAGSDVIEQDVPEQDTLEHEGAKKTLIPDLE